MTFYLIFSGWLTARRPTEGVGAFEVAGLIWALTGASAAMILSWMAAQTPEHTLDGAPQQAFYIFVAVSTIAALCDLKVILRRGISGAQRVARHVWRMCFGLFVASGSLFLGQAQVFPDWLRRAARAALPRAGAAAVHAVLDVLCEAVGSAIAGRRWRRPPPKRGADPLKRLVRFDDRALGLSEDDRGAKLMKRPCSTTPAMSLSAAPRSSGAGISLAWASRI